MSKTLPLLLLLTLSLALLVACGQEAPKPAMTQHGPATPVTATGEPERIVIDHILIMVKGPARGTAKARYADPAEAKAVAYRILDEVKGDGDWAALKKEHSEDGAPGRPGGPYTLVNHGVMPRSRSESKRSGMVPAFGDVGFGLKVGEISIADYDAVKSPFGYHIIKRIK